MKHYTYPCKHAETRLIARGVKVAYDGECVLLVHIKPYVTAAVAFPGDVVQIRRLEDGTIAANIRKEVCN